MKRNRHMVLALVVGVSAFTVTGCGDSEFENLSPRASAEDVAIAQEDYAAEEVLRRQQESQFFESRR